MNATRKPSAQGVRQAGASWLSGFAVFAVLAGIGPAAAGAGELRVIIEADGTVRQDGNYPQRSTDAPVSEPDPDDPGPVEGSEEDREQTVARAGLRLDLSYVLPRTALALSYNPSYEESLDDSELSGVTQVLRFGLSSELSRRSRLHLSDRLMESRNFETLASTPPTAGTPDAIAVTRRGDQISNSAQAGIELDLTRRTSLQLGASHRLRRFDEEDPVEGSSVGLSDSTSIGAHAGWRFELTESRSWQLLAGADRHEFESERETEVVWGGVGYSTEVARDGRFNGELGLFQADTREGPREPVERDSGWRGSFGLSYLRELYSWAVGYRHGVGSDIGLGRAVLTDSVYAGISTTGRRVTVGLSANASRSDDDLGGGDEVGGEDPGADGGIIDTATGTLRATWAFATWGRLTGGVSQIWQEADVAPFEDLSYTRYFMGFALRLYDSGERPIDPSEVGEIRNAEPDPR